MCVTFGAIAERARGCNAIAHCFLNAGPSRPSGKSDAGPASGRQRIVGEREEKSARGPLPVIAPLGVEDGQTLLRACRADIEQAIALLKLLG
jgi:hypothetical protein